ncbi:pilin [Corallincola platygyrae]|uniref:Pilin n=1 Tax=Corallincola platygyrae TaxID=1193278 RepID=A0ABW4XR46_9GAMM
MKAVKGFTLIELMIVVSIIGILATVSLPAYQIYVQRSEMTEAISMADHVKSRITKFYADNLYLPKDNREAGVPDANLLIGNRITGTRVINGAIHVTLGNKASQALQGKTLSFRPAVVKGSPSSPIAWLCGYSEAVEGMTAIGENRTDLPSEMLPSACR